MNKRIESYPFDWILSTPKSVYDTIVGLNYTNDVKKFVSMYFFHIDGYVKFLSPELFQTTNLKMLPYNSKTKFIFPHDHGDKSEIIEKYTRRLTRLKINIANDNYFVNFIFMNRLNSNLKFSVDDTELLNYAYLVRLYDYISTIRNLNSFKIIAIINGSVDIDLPEEKVTIIRINSANEVLDDDTIISALKKSSNVYL